MFRKGTRLCLVRVDHAGVDNLFDFAGWTIKTTKNLYFYTIHVYLTYRPTRITCTCAGACVCKWKKTLQIRYLTIDESLGSSYHSTVNFTLHLPNHSRPLDTGVMPLERNYNKTDWKLMSKLLVQINWDDVMYLVVMILKMYGKILRKFWTIRR